MMHTFPLEGFQISGDLEKDITAFMQTRKMRPYPIDMDLERFGFPFLRLSFGKNITVHTLTDGVVGTVNQTKLEDVPTEIPKLMQRSFLLEARRGKPLFEDVFSIGGFAYGDTIVLVVKTLSNNQPGLFCQCEKASFDGRSIDDMNMFCNKNFASSPSYMQIRTRKDIFSFAIKFSLLLEAEKTPLLIDTKQSAKHKTSPALQKRNNGTDWTTYRIYIDKTIKYEKSAQSHGVLDTEGRLLLKTNVKGHSKWQRYGHNLEKKKWIYIHPYEASRYFTEKDKKIIVDIYDKKDLTH